jgi:hypothetical protein
VRIANTPSVGNDTRTHRTAKPTGPFSASFFRCKAGPHSGGTRRKASKGGICFFMHVVSYQILHTSHIPFTAFAHNYNYDAHSVYVFLPLKCRTHFLGAARVSHSLHDLSSAANPMLPDSRVEAVRRALQITSEAALPFSSWRPRAADRASAGRGVLHRAAPNPTQPHPTRNNHNHNVTTLPAQGFRAPPRCVRANCADDDPFHPLPPSAGTRKADAAINQRVAVLRDDVGLDRLDRRRPRLPAALRVPRRRGPRSRERGAARKQVR